MDFIQQMQQGQSLWQAGKFTEAAEAFRLASQLSPQDPMAKANYGIALAKSDQIELALPILEDLAPRMNNPDLWFNLGNVYRAMLRLDEAVATYDKAIKLHPNHASAHWNRSLTLLLAGNFAEGWKEYEWRFRLSGRKPMPFIGPAWNGSLEALAGKTLIVGAEQGFGDTFQFARYIPIVAKHAARVILVCQPEVKALMGSLPGIGYVMSPGIDPIPKYDTHAALMSMGRLLGTTVETIPANVPYLFADAMKRDHWRSRLDQIGPTKKVGLVWGGRPTNANERFRAISLGELEPLANVPGVTLVSMQKGAPAEQLRVVPWSAKIANWTSELTNFSDTAALLSELDLLISVDTGVAHLAGALGKPAWTLVPSFPEWRWLRDRTDSPWYPTMKLIRQTTRMDWGPVVEQVRLSLSAFATAGH